MNDERTLEQRHRPASSALSEPMRSATCAAMAPRATRALSRPASDLDVQPLERRLSRTELQRRGEPLGDEPAQVPAQVALDAGTRC